MWLVKINNMVKSQFNFLLVLLIVTSFSCSHKINGCKPEMAIGEKTIKIISPDGYLKFQCPYYPMHENEKGLLDYGMCVMKNDEFKTIAEAIGKWTNEKEEPYAVVFYFNNFLSTLGETDSCIVSGFSTYTCTGNKIEHKLFIKKPGAFKESMPESIQVYTIISNQLQYILENKFSFSKDSPKSFVIIKNMDVINTIPGKHQYVFFPGEK